MAGINSIISLTLKEIQMVESLKALNVPANANENCPGVKSEIAGRS